MRKKIKENSGKVRRFFSGKGFYIALILCIAAIGISCYYLFNSLSNMTTHLPDEAQDTVMAGYDPGLGSSVYQPDTTDRTGSVPVTEPGPEEDIADVSGSAEVILPAEPAPETQTVPDEPPAAASAAPEPISIFVWPCSGFILSEFSNGELVYNRSTGDWRTHNGIDVAANAGTHVLAISSGTVIAVEDTVMEGTCVTIDHGDGLVSRYTGLQTVPTVKTGDTVFTGDVIGAIGTTSLTETVETPHLHFEMILNGIPVNPADYLPQMA